MGYKSNAIRQNLVQFTTSRQKFRILISHLLCLRCLHPHQLELHLPQFQTTLGLVQVFVKIKDSAFVQCFFRKILVMSVFFKHSLGVLHILFCLLLTVSIFQKHLLFKDQISHIQGFSCSLCSGIVSQVCLFAKDAILFNVKFVINCHQSVFSVGCFVLVSILPFQSTTYGKYIFLLSSIVLSQMRS